MVYADTFIDHALHSHSVLGISKDILYAVVTACLLFLMIRYYDLSMKHAQEALQLEERKFRELFENASDAIFLYELRKNDVPSTFIEVNRVACEQLGYTRDELLTMSLSDIIDKSTLEKVPMHIKEMLVNGSITCECFHVTKDGRVIPNELSSRVFTWDGKKVVLSIVRYTAERKQAEEELLRSEKLAVVGELAAGVAHEIRNPLTSIKGFIQLLSRNKENVKYCIIILSEIERINGIVSEFLMIAKPQAQNLKSLQIKGLIQDVISLLDAHAVLSNVQITCESDSKLSLVTGDESQLKQVFINVMKNAIDAMPNGGAMSVEARMYDEKEIMIRVMDRGCGIPKERLSKIGEPFYTTKEKGTGLGLMVSKRIMEAHHGEIKIMSEEGVGTIVDIVLPAC